MTKPFRPMLAAVAELDKLRFPLYASEKLDGVRCIVRDGVVMSRTMKPIPNPAVQSAFGRPELEGCDGELIVGRPTAPDCYRVTVGGVMREYGEPDVRFYVFDRVLPGTFRERLCAIVDSGLLLTPRTVLVRQGLVLTQDGLDSLEAVKLAEGHEGLILRAPEGLYKQGRSTAREQGMLKLKRFEDAEAEILEVVQGTRNDNPATKNALGRTERSSHQANKTPLDTAGALRVRDIVTGQEFNIGTGFTDAIAKDFWNNRESYVGQLVKYQHFAVGAKELPRFPSFKGMRDRIDLGEPALEASND